MIWSLSAVVALIAASAFFVAAEFALIAARRSMIEPQAVRSARARSTLTAMENVSVMMACAQLGVTVCGLVLGAIGEPAVAQLITPVLRGLHLPDAAREPVAITVALLIVVSLHVAFGEMVPKNIALAAPQRTALLLTPVLGLLARLLGPLVRGLDRLANLVVRALGITPVAEVTSTFTRAEVAGLIAESAAAGLIDPEDLELADAALNFDTSTVRDLALPDAGLICVGPDPTAAQVEQACARSGFSRFPVLASGSTRDRYAGYVHVRDVLALERIDMPVPDRYIRPMPALPATTSLRAALEQMQRDRSHLCRVVTNGAALGVVMLEDIIEVLVGDIADATRRAGGGPLG